MEGYILAACGAVILSSLILLVLPEGKTGRFIGGILRLFCLLVMLTPLLALLREGGEGELFGSAAQEELVDEEFISYAFSLRAEEQERALEEELARDGLRVQVRIGWKSVEYAYTVTDVHVLVQDFGIYGPDEHIFVIERLQSRVAALFDGAEVVVHGG